jgi:hypothetical protein
LKLVLHYELYSADAALVLAHKLMHTATAAAAAAAVPLLLSSVAYAAAGG